ncbi:MAG: glycosyltransferase family 2 protein, partial [Spirochaetaceae bacterium]|nr:glycosyltransferase family 2 protein [Spirochaetaceae bacterium]
HGTTVSAVAEELTTLGLSVFLVNDGSKNDTKIILEALASDNPRCELLQLDRNLGKGAAVIAGFKRALDSGYTQAFQIDADGQHDLGEVPGFLDDSRAHPDALIAGNPVYNNAPSLRVNGRKITNFWVSIETISRDIPDTMCGFRIYPIQQTMRVLKSLFTDKRMGFDTEVIVRLYWLGIPIRFHPVKVVYPEGGLSNFRMVRDNLHISLVHTRLFFGMIPRIPFILFRRLL